MTARIAPASIGAGAVGPGSPRPRRRWGRWLLVLGVGLVVLVGVALLALRHPPIATGLVNAVLGHLALVPRSTTSVQEVRVNWISGLEIRGLRITRGDTLLAAVDTLRARYRLASLLVGRPEVDDIHVGGVLLTAGIAETTRPTVRKPTPRLTLLDLLRGRFYSGPPLRVERVTVRDARYGGHAGAPDSAFTRFDLRARRVRLGGGFSFELDTLGLSGRGVELALVARLDEGRFELRSMRMHGASSDVEARGFALGARDSLAGAGLTLRAQPLSLRDLEALIPGLRLDGVVLADADLHGSRADRLSGTLSASMERGRFANFELGPTRIDAVLADGRAELTASARYEGALATLGGWIRPLDATPSYDIEARIDRLPMRIPGARGWAPLAERVDAAARLRVRGTGYADAALEVTGGAEIDEARIDLEGRLDLTGDFTWNVKRLAFDRLDVAALAGDTTTSAFTGTLTASGAGLGPESRRAAATLEIGPSHYGGLAVAGARVRARMDGSSLGGSLRLQTDAGAIEVDSLTTQWAGPGRFRVNGAFHDLDLGRLLGQPALSTRLEGTLSAQGHGLAALGAPGGPSRALRGGRLAGQARLELKPSEFRGQEVAGVTRVVLARGALEIGGNLASPAGRIDLDADARPFDAAPSYALRRARFDDVDLAAWSGVPSLTSRISGSLTGAGHRGDATGHTEDWRAALHLDPSRMGPADLEGGEVRATWSAGRAGVVASLRASGDTASLRGDIDLRGGERRGQAVLSIPFGLLAAAIGRDSLPSRGGLEATASFSGASPARATAEGRITGRGAIDRARLDSLFAGFRLRDGTLTLDTLVARSNLGVAGGAGRVALFDSTGTTSSDLRLALAVSDLLPLRSLVGADTLALGSGTLDLHLGGTAVERTVDGRASLRSAAWNQLRLLGATGSVQGALDRGWRPTTLNTEASIRRLHGLAIPVSEGAVRATLEGDRTAFDLTVKLDERYHLHAVGQSLAESIGTRLTLATLDVQADSAAWKLVRTARVDLRPGRVGIEDFDLRSAGGRITAQGVIDRRGDQDFRLDLRGVPLDFVSQLLGRESVSGTLSGGGVLEGPAAAPRGRGELRLDLVSDQGAAGDLRSNLVWDEGRLDFRGRFATPEDDSIAWSGRLPLAVSLAASDSGKAPAPVQLSEGDIDVRIVADRFPLEGLTPLLDPRSIGKLSGVLDIDAGLRGSSRTLAGSGTIELIDGSIPLPGLGVTYEHLNLQARFDGNRLVLQRAHAVSSKGTLDVSGEIRFVSATQIEPRLQIKASRFAFVQTPDVRAILSGEVDLSGSVAEPVVKATATIENSTFTFAQPDRAGGAPGSDVKLSDADLRMMEETFGYVKAKTPTGDLVRAGFEASDLDLSIRLERNNWLRQRVQPKLAVALTGQFRIRKKPHAEPELFGRIEPIPGRGYVEQFARSFDIVGGEVLLNGKMKDHRVDLQAQYKPPTSTESSEDEVVVNLDVEGTAEKLSLTLSSEPAMSEAEIVNFIATGQSPVDHSSSGSSESNMLKDIGLSAVSGGAEQAAQEKIGLDVLQVRFDALQGATLVAGRYLDSQLYVGFRQPLQYQDTGTTNSETTSRTSVEVEYAIYRWLVVNLQGETSKLRSFFRARHAY